MLFETRLEFTSMLLRDLRRQLRKLLQGALSGDVRLICEQYIFEYDLEKIGG